MTIVERMARVADCIRREQATAGIAVADTQEQKKSWGSFDKWNDSPVFNQPNEGKGEMDVSI